MSEEPLPEELLDLLSVDPPASSEAQSRLATRLTSSLAATAAAPALASEVLTELASEAAGHAAGAAAAGTTAAGVVSTKVALLMAFGGLGVGAAGGAATYHALSPAPIVAPDETVIVDEHIDVGPGEDAGDDSGEDLEMVTPEPPVLPAPVTPEVIDEEPEAGPDESRRRERVLLRQAQSALVRSQPEDALSALARHRRRFPSSDLGEERDALEVDALVAAERHDDAATKAQRFLQTYPSSIFAPRVRRALAP